MKRRMAVVLVVFFSTALFASAQVAETLIVDVPFPFYVGSKQLPAGSYRIQATNNLEEITVSSINGNQSAYGGVITQISSAVEDKSSVVFDVTGNDHYLSEVYMQGENGYLIKATPSKHTHVRVKGRK